MTREEELWAAIVAALNGDDVDVPVPAWRREEFLVGILGAIKGVEGATVPEPVWREEQYLKAMFDAISEGGGGGSSYELIHSEEVTASTTSTSRTEIKKISLGADAYTGDKLLLVRVRDKAGPRTNYFYGCDALCYNYAAAQGSNFGGQFNNVTLYVNSNGKFAATSSTLGSGYGVYPDVIYGGSGEEAAGDIRLNKRYNSSYGTVDGTYIVEAYLITMPDGNPLFPVVS